MNVVQEDRTKSVSQRVYELLTDGSADHLVGRIVTFADLLTVGCDIQKSRAPVYQAGKWLQEKNGLNLVAVKGVGYQIVHPNEAPVLMNGFIGRAGRQIVRSRRVGEFTNRTMMTREIRTQTEAMLACALGLQQEIKDVSRRQNFHAQLLAQHSVDIENLKSQSGVPFSDEQIEALKEMIAKNNPQI